MFNSVYEKRKLFQTRLYPISYSKIEHIPYMYWAWQRGYINQTIDWN